MNFYKRSSLSFAIILILICLTGLVGCADLTVEQQPDAGTPDGVLTVHYIDVGQGEATLLQGPDFTMLIDAGRHDRDEVVPYLQEVGVTTLDLVVGTHPHADHIGQLDDVMKGFDVREVWMSGSLHTSKTFERVLDAILDSEADYHEPRAGEKYHLGGLLLEVLSPKELIGDLNEDSIVLRATYGQVRFLFTGDAEAGAEEEMLTQSDLLAAELLQLSHHGSSTSSADSFLEAVSPEVAIYSAGADNTYGHPHEEVVQRVQSHGIELYGTDVHGTILVTTDGADYEIMTERD